MDLAAKVYQANAANNAGSETTTEEKSDDDSVEATYEEKN
jgi:hypothetical protein